MRRGFALLLVVPALVAIPSAPAEAGHHHPAWCAPVYHAPVYVHRPIYCPPVVWHWWCPPIHCPAPAYPCGTITGGSVVVIVDGPAGLTDVKVTVDGKDAKQQTAYPIFVTAETVALEKEVDFKVTGKVGNDAYVRSGKAKGNTTNRVVLEKGMN